MKKISFLSILMLSACVTINIYFPAAAAEKVADEIIKDIQDNVPGKAPAKPATEPKSEGEFLKLSILKWIDSALNVVISPVHADEANLSIDSPEIRQLTAAMENRFSALQGFYTAGVIGIKADGLIAIKDPAAVPLKERNSANKLVAAENADRQALYQAIANANGHPEWASQIQSTFASRWISNAKPGWWVQSGGGWVQK